MRFLTRSAAALCALAVFCTSAARDDDPARAPVDEVTVESLLARFAPVVLLSPGERALPANVEWYLARAGGGGSGSGATTGAEAAQPAQATLLRGWDAFLREVGRSVERLRPHPAARPGSQDSRDWTVYGHVYPAQGAGVLVQYWFFYPFNDFHVLFDHEGDWEHVTVRLDELLRPVGAWFARHKWSAPGEWFPWSALAREGDHPVVLSARGSHASYAAPEDVLWWDRACPTRDPAAAERAGCRVWRTWAPGTGGVVDTGARNHPRARAAFLAWPGEWGTVGWFRRESGGPRGPAYQQGWCSEGVSGCT
jgi:VPS62-like protein